MTALFWGFSALAATTYTVDPAGGGDATTIRDGLAMLADGDTLMILGGVYGEGNLVKNLGVTTVYIIGVDQPVLDGSNTDADWLLQVEAGAVRGLTFQGMPEGVGLGVGYQEEGLSLLVDDCTFVGVENAFISSASQSVTIQNSTFISNERAIWTYGGTYDLVVYNNLFYGNAEPFYTNEPSSGPGGDDWLVANNTFIDNGRIAIQQGSLNFGTNLPNLSIANNVVIGADSGFYIYNSGEAHPTFEGEFHHNVIDDDVLDPIVVNPPEMLQFDNVIGEVAFRNWVDDDDWTNDDLRLDWASTGIDLGADSVDSPHALPTTDFVGRARAMDGDLDGVALPDAGAFEADPDEDLDGHAVTAAGGDDCDDAHPAIHGGAVDVCDDGVDQDCSGADAACDTGDTAGDSGGTDTDSDSGAPVDDPGKPDGGGCGCASGPRGGGWALVAFAALACARWWAAAGRRYGGPRVPRRWTSAPSKARTGSSRRLT